MRKLLLGTVGALAIITSASAADMAARPYDKAPMLAMYDWSGFYLGANGGWGSSHKCWDFSNAAGAFNVSEGCHDATGGTAGGQVGYRMQSSYIVFGVEAQGNWANFRGSNVSIPFPAVTNATHVDAFGLFTGQIGYAWNNTLLYLKGGAALTSDRYWGYLTANGLQISNTVNDTRWGGVIGVGLEYGFAPNWSFAVEYDHMFMQDRFITFTNNGTLAPAGTAYASDRIHQDVDLVTVRLNYRWGGAVVARY
ncbi:MAG: outer membrane beta-barrel protein [Bradyrhizobium sp.]|nr:outer membrane beta-barrel protein [Bradyrhizobium sp.]